MKKIFCFAVIAIFLASCVATNKIPESKVQSRTANYISLSTLLTYFETGDRPTQDEFEDAWSNSYNSVSDGMWDLTGYPSIGFTPYSTMQIGKFSQVAGFPTDTTTKLNWNGTLAVSNLWVNGQKWTGTGGAEWTLSGGVLYPTSTATNMAIRATTSLGYDLFVNGTTYSLTSLRTRMLNLENSLGGNGTVSIDAFGNLQFTDMFNGTPITLSSLGGAAAWRRVAGQISPTTTTDIVNIGSGSADSLFNVYGTSYFEDAAYFDGTVRVDAPILTDEYIQTPAVNFSYGINTGRWDLYNSSGKLTAYDSDYPTGVTLAQLASKLTLSGTSLYPNLTTYNMVLGATDPLGYKLRVNGTSMFGGSALFSSGITIPTTQRVNFTSSYIYESGGVLRLRDLVAGDVTLSDLINPVGTSMDSLSVSRLNVDTMYFNGTQYKTFFSPHSNAMYIKNQNATFAFEYLNPLSVLGVGALRFTLANDTMKSNPAWPELGKFIINQADTVAELYAGAVRGWEKMATQPWVTEAILGGIGGNPTFDTIWVDANSYITSAGVGSWGIKFENTLAGNKPMILGMGTSAGFTWATINAHIWANADSLSFRAGGGYYRFDGDYWFNATDTLATQAYARSFGGGGTGTPGGSAGDLQYNNSGSFGGFWAYDGTDIVPTSGTGISWATTSFIEGYAADSVRIGRTVSNTNNYTSETGQKNNFKSIQGYAGGYLNSLSNVYLNYNDANANNGLAYGLYSHLYSDENYATAGNTSYSNAGRFILQNRGTTTIGGGSPGTVYLNGLYGEITGAINADGTPGVYTLAAIYGKDSHTGTATGYAGYFDGNVRILGDIDVSGYFALGNLSEEGYVWTSDWSISNQGIMTGISGITNDAAITSTGGIVSLNASSNYAVNVATGTSTGAISLGGGSNTVAVNSTSWDISTAGAVSGLTTLSMSGQLTSTLATGTSPLAVTSTTVNTNFNADLLDGQTGSYYQTATNLTAGTIPGDRGVTAGSATSSFLEYNGTTRTPGQMYGGTTSPTGTTRLNYDGYLYASIFYGEFFMPRVAAETDTFAAVIYPGGHIDTASLAFAAKGWEYELEDFDIYYAKASELKSLPLPFPNGKERRKVNPLYANYQLEFELERLTRYLKAEREDKKILEARIAKLEESANLPKKIRKSRTNLNR